MQREVSSSAGRRVREGLGAAGVCASAGAHLVLCCPCAEAVVGNEDFGVWFSGDHRTSCHGVLELQVWQSRARSGFVLALLLPCGGAMVTEVVKSITICRRTGVILSRLLLCHQNWVIGVYS